MFCWNDAHKGRLSNDYNNGNFRIWMNDSGANSAKAAPAYGSVWPPDPFESTWIGATGIEGSKAKT